MSSALGWHYHNMMWGTVMYCLSKYQIPSSGLLHIVDKFYMNIMPLRPSEIDYFQFPRISDGILANTQTS
jgi:hypothetical protein